MKIITDTKLNGAVILDDDSNFVTATTLANFGQVISSSSASYDSGFMPQNDTGLVSFRKSGDYTQIAYQLEKGFFTVKWGVHEGDSDADVVNLAHPYKIWIADFYKDRLVGLRHFVVPEPVFSLNDPLYHIPLPNTNCRGYNNTSVGWVCLYRTGNEDLISLQEKIHYAYERESGLHEPYNNNNMSGTDGPRFYRDKKINSFLTPASWVARTNSEGANWVLDPANLIPIKVAPKTLALQHADDGEEYTLGKALNEPYYPYYRHQLAEDQIKFYEAGWSSNISGVNSFTPQILSKLASVEPPKELDVQALLDSLHLQIPKVLDFASWTSEVKLYLSRTILGLKTSCCLCGSNEFNLDDILSHKVTPFFYCNKDITSSVTSTPQNQKLHIEYVDPETALSAGFQALECYEYDLEDTLGGIDDDFEDGNPYSPDYTLKDELYLCNNCTKLSLQVIFQDGSVHRVFTKNGFLKILKENSAIANIVDCWDRALEDEYFNIQDFNFYAEINNFFSQLPYMSPQCANIRCTGCESVIPLKFNLDNSEPIIPQAFHAALDWQIRQGITGILQAWEVGGCSHCATILEHLLPKEFFIASGNVPKKFSDFPGIESNFSNDMKYFKISNSINLILNTDKVNPQVYKIPEALILNKWELMHQYFYATMFIKGAPYLVIDTFENFKNLNQCDKCNTMYIGSSCEQCSIEGLMVFPEITNNNSSSEESENIS